MSIKTIAVGTDVYTKLAHRKQPGQSFTKLIDRLLDSTASSGTCADAVRDAAQIWGATGAQSSDADKMENIIRDNRRNARWDVEKP
jgi:negative regulator of replication initiation